MLNSFDDKTIREKAEALRTAVVFEVDRGGAFVQIPLIERALLDAAEAGHKVAREKCALIAIESRVVPEVDNNRWFRMRAAIAKKCRGLRLEKTK